jgi:hypothetical protein
MPRKTKVRADLIAVVAIFLIALLFAPFFINRQKSNPDRRAGPPTEALATNAREGSPSGRGTAPAAGPAMTYDQPPLTTVGEILKSTNVAGTTTLQVQLAGVKVQKVLSGQYILVGSDPDHAIPVRLKELHPEIREGQTLNVTGMIQQLGNDLAHWELDEANKRIVSRFPVFINAINL